MVQPKQRQWIKERERSHIKEATINEILEMYVPDGNPQVWRDKIKSLLKEPNQPYNEEQCSDYGYKYNDTHDKGWHLKTIHNKSWKEIL